MLGMIRLIHVLTALLSAATPCSHAGLWKLGQLPHTRPRAKGALPFTAFR